MGLVYVCYKNYAGMNIITTSNINARFDDYKQAFDHITRVNATGWMITYKHCDYG